MSLPIQPQKWRGSSELNTDRAVKTKKVIFQKLESTADTDGAASFIFSLQPAILQSSFFQQDFSQDNLYSPIPFESCPFSCPFLRLKAQAENAIPVNKTEVDSMSRINIRILRIPSIKFEVARKIDRIE